MIISPLILRAPLFPPSFPVCAACATARLGSWLQGTSCLLLPKLAPPPNAELLARVVSNRCAVRQAPRGAATCAGPEDGTSPPLLPWGTDQSDSQPAAANPPAPFPFSLSLCKGCDGTRAPRCAGGQLPSCDDPSARPLPPLIFPLPFCVLIASYGEWMSSCHEGFVASHLKQHLA